MTLLSCIYFYSFLNGISPSLTSAVISVESSGNPFALGSAKEVGLMQIKPQFVPESALQLGQSCTNVMRGTSILKEMRIRCKHTVDKTFLICYNLGRARAAKIKQPKNQSYYKKVIAKMEY